MIRLPIAVRPLLPSEEAMVLSSWKRDYRSRILRSGCGILERDYWRLANFVIDNITLPTCEVFVGHHHDDPDTIMCWVALRRIPELPSYEVVYSYARRSIMRDPILAGSVERVLFHEAELRLPEPSFSIATERRPFNLFQELPR